MSQSRHFLAKTNPHAVHCSGASAKTVAAAGAVGDGAVVRTTSVHDRPTTRYGKGTHISTSNTHDS